MTVLFSSFEHKHIDSMAVNACMCGMYDSLFDIV